MIGMNGARGLRIKTFCSDNKEEIEKDVNDFIREHDGDIVDLQYGASDRTFDIMAVYTAREEKE